MRTVFIFLFSLNFIYSIYAQNLDSRRLVYKTESGNIYSPEYKYGENKLKNEFVVSLQSQRYSLEYFDYGKNKDRVLIMVALDIDKDGNLTKYSIFANPPDVEKLQPALDRVFTRTKDSWLPAYVEYKDSGNKENIGWSIYVELFFKSERLEEVIVNYSSDS